MIKQDIVGVAEATAREIMTILRKYGAQKVFIFGSSVSGKQRENSDIDLACSGIPPELFFKAYGELLFQIDQHIDLVDLTELKETLRRRIEREGLLVYEAE